MEKLDLYQRTCIKKGILAAPPEEEEIEIIDAESTEASMEEEEEEEQLIEEEPIDVKAIQDELECLKRRIQKLQLILKAKALKECLDDVCVENVATCSENIEICALQKANHKLQCKINEIVECLKFSKTQIEELRARLCDKTKEIHELQKNIAQLQFWRKNLHNEFGVCIERFEYIKHVKVEWKEVRHYFQLQMRELIGLDAIYVPQKVFDEIKQLFCFEVCAMMNHFNEFHRETMLRLVALEEQFKKSGSSILTGEGQTAK